ncbi:MULTISPECIES: hypothetical protein [Megasphaera]|uniref:hypothetical protein n=1 Tax=Megasphaera TaxID=906 RepID=UPI00079A5681|nr:MULTISPECIES: hypothetical protein [Megasphaera]MBS6138268.1 hypothetical protein [Megasphaera sp.]KXA69408.1 hypothetical protein HMPREF3201_01055 [Megasphaera sp. MJR8396C]MCB6404065.1 hypothetical protein [Megasphaera massiliensis]MCB7348661.1 hypothetical protein [Megasphaera massiliensis]MCQ5323615.1 hypothetical protein [Megasphaera massiliensis]
MLWRPGLTFLGHIVSYITLFRVSAIIKKIADDSVLTDGLVDYDKLQPILYDCSTKTYHLIGPVVGKAFHDGLVLKK